MSDPAAPPPESLRPFYAGLDPRAEPAGVSRPARPPVVVALGSGPEALRLIYAGFRMAREHNQPWVAVHVEVPSDEGAEEAEMARQWLREAQDLGARVRWMRAPTVVLGLLEAIKAQPVSSVVLGKSRRQWPWSRLGHSTYRELSLRRPDVPVRALDTEAAGPSGTETKWNDVAGSLVAAALVLAAFAAFSLLLPWETGLAAGLISFIPAVAFLTYRWGQAIGAVSVLASALFFCYFLASPRHSFHVEDGPSAAVFTTLLVATHRVAQLVKRLRAQEKEMRRRQAQATALYLFGRTLARCSRLEDVAEAVERHFKRNLDVSAQILVPRGEAWVVLPGGEEGILPPEKAEFLTRLSSAPDPLAPVELGGAFFLPLLGSHEFEGLLRLQGPAHPGPDTWDLCQALSVQAALCLERLRWLEEAHQYQVESETERTRSALLSAISHDLRTPLAAIHGAAGSLLLEHGLDEATRKDLLSMIQEESAHLTRVLSNLLDLTRLESGSLQAQKEWQPLEEVAGAALGRAELREFADEVGVNLPEDLPLVPLDGALMEQVLVNLLKNAHLHGSGSEVTLGAWIESNTLELAVEDRGPGVPEPLKTNVFDKFFRLPGAAGGGAGLGLAISRAIVLAHGGRIWVEDREGGGSRFRVSLPAGAPPAFEPEATP